MKMELKHFDLPACHKL